MKTIYLRKKRSGNFEFSNKENATSKFTTKKTLKEFWKQNCESLYAKRVIKAYYRLSQIYFNNFNEFYEKCKSL